MSDITLEQLVNHFQLANRAEGKSPKTLSWYQQNLGLFIRFLEDEDRSTLLRDVGLDEARAFVISLQEQDVRFANNLFTPARRHKLSTHSINSAARAIRAFFNWLFREGYTTSHKLKDLRVPRVQKKMVDVLTAEEIASIFGCLNAKTATGSRDYAIVMCLLDCGLRASELVGLKSSNTDLVSGSLRVVGKGNKERLVPLGSRAAKALMQYREVFRPEPADPLVDTFFLSLDGRVMTFDALKTMLQRLGRRAGVPRLHVVTWALTREELARYVANDFHARIATMLTEGGAVASGRMAPSLEAIFVKLVADNDFIEMGVMFAPIEACDRARRDLEGAVGMKVAACKAKLEPDQGFATVS